jgi:ribose-phosphate pyrophosphokinase
MILFATRSAQHLAQRMTVQQGAYTIKQFSDGELFVRLDQDVAQRHVWVLAATQPPAENLLELFFLLDALQRAGASLNLCISYFGYARQIIAEPGESCSAELISNILKQFPLKQVSIVHPHSLLLQNFLPFTPIFDIPFFCEQAAHYDAIAAPDKGAADWATTIARACHKELILLTKTRPEQEQVEIASADGRTANQKILLVDDMISTGRTLVAAAETLINLGASSVAAAATHGVFAPGSQEFLAQSVLETVYVTNTIDQAQRKLDKKVTVIDISSTIMDSIRFATHHERDNLSNRSW